MDDASPLPPTIKKWSQTIPNRISAILCRSEPESVWSVEHVYISAGSKLHGHMSSILINSLSTRTSVLCGLGREPRVHHDIVMLNPSPTNCCHKVGKPLLSKISFQTVALRFSFLRTDCGQTVKNDSRPRSMCSRACPHICPYSAYMFLE